MKEPAAIHSVFPDSTSLREGEHRCCAVMTEMKKKQGELQSPDPRKANSSVHRPFDTRELEHLPMPTEQDPPYRPWWVVDYGDLRIAISKRRHAV